MQYFLEQLGEKRFQQLCQAILLKDHPNLQCLPVGQPDGGRDALERIAIPNVSNSDAVIFQVKFVFDPQKKESREQIESLIRSESRKVRKLIERGAKKYYFLTNAGGTSHLDVGSIDRLNRVLSDELGIESYCWWRDDLERRIDGQPEIMWSFPEILRAQDLLQSLLEGGATGASSKQTNAIRAYMAQQESVDSKLKFKQVELQKNISDLFVDVPARVAASREEGGKLLKVSLSSDELAFEDEGDLSLGGLDRSDRHLDATPGALRLLAHDRFVDNYSMVVLEGAPGQGKSTVTQFLCQLHRWTLLNRGLELTKIDASSKPSSVRIPFRVDLRDFANWLSGRNPFLEDFNSKGGQFLQPKLESFLAAQVVSATGQDFTASDLVQVSTHSKILIVLDGFDEVADVGLRNKIVREATEASARFSANALSVQFLVTSRPAAFANSQGFPREDWQHVQLLSLSRRGIIEYGEKWLSARGTEGKDKNEVMTVLRTKLQQAHVRELARNPMQLAILLSLISVQGPSLPDKRTALYDKYIEIFLNRESEKSDVIRANRTLIFRIHQYVAWILQSEAETEKGAGNITVERLREEVRKFLEVRGHRTDLVDELFRGMIERVVVLVSRIQGTLEFEVQPLREYFAARYLYDTAPYTPPGKFASGTLPDRFRALAKNSYWLNVTRFYSGCYSSGELASLYDDMDEILSTDEFRNLAHVPRLALIFSIDFVFNEQPRLAKKIISNLVGGNNFRIALAAEMVSGVHQTDFRLPEGAAQDELVALSFERLPGSSGKEIFHSLTRNILMNLEGDKVFENWKCLEDKFHTKEGWFEAGVHLGVFSRYSYEDLMHVLSQCNDELRFDILLSADSTMYERHSELGEIVFYQSLKTGFDGSRILFRHHGLSGDEVKSPYSLASVLFTAFFVARLYQADDLRSLRDRLIAVSYPGVRIFKTNAAEAFAGIGASSFWQSLGVMIDKFLDEPATDRSSIFSAYSELMEFVVQEVGVQCALCKSAVFLAGSLDVEFDASTVGTTICSRAAVARSNSMRFDWWSQALDMSGVVDGYDNKLLMLCAYRWMPVSLIVPLHLKLGRLLDALSLSDWRTLFEGAVFGGDIFEDDVDDEVRLAVHGDDMLLIECPELPEEVSERLMCLLLSRVSVEIRQELWKKHFADYDGSDLVIWSTILNCAVAEALLEVDSWSEVLDFFERANSRGVFWYGGEHSLEQIVIPQDIAIEICSNSSKYPHYLIGLAERVLAARVGENVTHVGAVARDNKWQFSD